MARVTRSSTTSQAPTFALEPPTPMNNSFNPTNQAPASILSSTRSSPIPIPYSAPSPCPSASTSRGHTPSSSISSSLNYRHHPYAPSSATSSAVSVRSRRERGCTGDTDYSEINYGTDDEMNGGESDRVLENLTALDSRIDPALINSPGAIIDPMTSTASSPLTDTNSTAGSKTSGKMKKLVGPKPKTSHARKTEPGHIKRPPNAFILFRSHCCNPSDPNLPSNQPLPPGTPSAQQLVQLGITDHRHISRIVSHLWKSLTKDEKFYWDEKAKQAQIEHLKENPNYRYKPIYRDKELVRRRRKGDRDEIEEEKKACQALASELLNAQLLIPEEEKWKRTQYEESAGSIQPETVRADYDSAEIGSSPPEQDFQPSPKLFPLPAIPTQPEAIQEDQREKWTHSTVLAHVRGNAVPPPPPRPPKTKRIRAPKKKKPVQIPAPIWVDQPKQQNVEFLYTSKIPPAVPHYLDPQLQSYNENRFEARATTGYNLHVPAAHCAPFGRRVSHTRTRSQNSDHDQFEFMKMLNQFEQTSSAAPPAPANFSNPAQIVSPTSLQLQNYRMSPIIDGVAPGTISPPRPSTTSQPVTANLAQSENIVSPTSTTFSFPSIGQNSQPCAEYTPANALSRPTGFSTALNNTRRPSLALSIPTSGLKRRGTLGKTNQGGDLMLISPTADQFGARRFSLGRWEVRKPSLLHDMLNDSEHDALAEVVDLPQGFLEMFGGESGMNEFNAALEEIKNGNDSSQMMNNSLSRPCTANASIRDSSERPTTAASEFDPNEEFSTNHRQEFSHKLQPETQPMAGNYHLGSQDYFLAPDAALDRPLPNQRTPSFGAPSSRPYAEFSDIQTQPAIGSASFGGSFSPLDHGHKVRNERFLQPNGLTRARPSVDETLSSQLASSNSFYATHAPSFAPISGLNAFDSYPINDWSTSNRIRGSDATIRQNSYSQIAADQTESEREFALEILRKQLKNPELEIAREGDANETGGPVAGLQYIYLQPEQANDVILIDSILSQGYGVSFERPSQAV